LARPAELAGKAFAKAIASRSDEQLDRLVRGRRRTLLLGVIFRQMPGFVNPALARTLDTAVEWRINGTPGSSPDVYQVVLEGGRCTVTRKPRKPPVLTLTMGTVDFLRLASGAKKGPELYMSGRLRIEGDLMVAARLPQFFRVPVG
jgi:hypothetical protein